MKSAGYAAGIGEIDPCRSISVERACSSRRDGARLAPGERRRISRHLAIRERGGLDRADRHAGDEQGEIEGRT